MADEEETEVLAAPVVVEAKTETVVDEPKVEEPKVEEKLSPAEKARQEAAKRRGITYIKPVLDIHKTFI